MAKFKLERKLYSKDQYISDMIEKAFCDGYELAQRMYAGGQFADSSANLTPEQLNQQISKDWLHRERREKEMAAAWGDGAVESTRTTEIKNQPQVETPKPDKKPRAGSKAALEAEKAELQRQLDAANKSHESKLGDMRKNSETQANKIKELEKQLKEKSKGLSSKEKNKILQQGRQKGRRQVGLIGGMQNQWRKSSTLGKAGMVGAGVAGAGALIGTGALINRATRKDD